MRDKRFISENRGGLLTKDNHRKLIKWASECPEHVLKIIDTDVDKRLLNALKEAMKASMTAHTVARESRDPVSTAIARSVGHAIATAHMADHSVGAALYALKALKLAGRPISEEQDWQSRQLQKLPLEIADLVLITIADKAKGLKIY